MKKVIGITALIFSLSSIPVFAMMCGGMGGGNESHAQGVEKGKQPFSQSTNPVRRPDGVIDLNNTLCPVTGQAVSGNTFFQHAGVHYGLCCDMCKAQFSGDPGRYVVKQSVIQDVPANTGHTDHSGHAH